MLTIDQRLADEMVAHSREEYPNECCGILAGKDGSATRIYRVTNIRKSPNRYLMDPQEQLDAMLDTERNGGEILAFYHSHPHGNAHPSSVDVRMALQSGWLDVYYVLVSLRDRDNPSVRAFNITRGGEIVERDLEFN